MSTALNFPEPVDLVLLREQGAELLEQLGLRWCDPGETPAGFVASDPPSSAWTKMFGELSFVLEQADLGFWYALWRYSASEPRVIVVRLDSEAELETTATLSDAFVELSQGRSSHERVLGFFQQHGIEAAADTRALVHRRRLFPAAELRLTAHENGSVAAATRDADPRAIADLLAMRGTDPRVAEFLAAIENPLRPLSVETDFDGRIVCLMIDRDNLSSPVEVLQLTFGMPRAHVLQVLGAPSRTTPPGAKFPNDVFQAGTLRLRVNYKDDLVSRFTLNAV